MAALVLASCAGSNGVNLEKPAANATVPPPGPSSPMSQSPTPTAEALARQQVLAVYRAGWSAGDEVFRIPEAQRAAYLAQWLGEPALSSVLRGTKSQVDRGRTVWGHADIPIEQTVVVTGVQAVVTGCLDSSKGGLADAATGRRLTVGIPRNPVQQTVTKTSQGWRITFSRSLLRTPAGDKACA